MNFCPKCNAVIQLGADACEHCGFSLRMQPFDPLRDNPLRKHPLDRSPNLPDGMILRDPPPTDPPGSPLHHPNHFHPDFPLDPRLNKKKKRQFF